MAKFNFYPYELSCTRQGTWYFPKNSRRGLFFAYENWWAEYAPFPGINNLSINDFKSELETIDPASLGEMESCISNLPVNDEIKYTLSMATFFAWMKTHPEEFLKKRIKLSELIAGPTSEHLSMAHRAYGSGFGCLKIKINANVPTEADKIKRIRDLVGPNVSLRLDANRGFSLAQAVAFLHSLRKIKIDYFEEPLCNIHELKSLHETSGIPIALDESFLPDMPLERVGEWGAQVLVVKPSRFGSIFDLFKRVKRAKDLGIRVIFSPTFESEFSMCLHALAVVHLGLEADYHGAFYDGIFKTNVFSKPVRSARGWLNIDDVLYGLNQFDVKDLPHAPMAPAIDA